MKHPVKMLLAVLMALLSIGIASAQDGALTTITLSGDTIAVEGDGAAVDGAMVTITDAGSYSLSGTLTDGQIIVDAAGVVSLILDGVEINSVTSAAIDVQNADSVTITLTEGTQNRITASANADEIEAALFSNVDLTIDGSGSLTVQSDNNHGIASETALSIIDMPTITVNAGGDGLKSTVSMAIESGAVSIESGDDGIQSDQDFVMNGGSLVIPAVDKALHSTYNLEINDGVINILTAEEGIEGGYITINGGDLNIVTNEDGINVSIPDEDTTAEAASGRSFNAELNPYYLQINGGSILVNAEGDGLDSNASIEITGGTTIVYGPTQSMNGAIDYDGIFNINGGTLIAVGSAQMPQAPSDSSTQNSVMINLDSSQAAGTLLHFQTSDGDSLLTISPMKAYQSIVFSSLELTDGLTVDVYSDGNSDGNVVGGLYTDGTYTPGTLENSFTISNTITQIGEIRRMH